MRVLHEYYLLIDRLSSSYGINIKPEHEFVYEAFEGPVSLFKLTYKKPKEKQKEKLLLSFHIDLDSIDAIQWYVRVQQLVPYIILTECYFKDDNDETYFGQDAEILKRYKLQQEIISEWSKDKEDTKKFVDSKIIGRDPKSGPRYYLSAEDAEADFYRMSKEDKNTRH